MCNKWVHFLVKRILDLFLFTRMHSHHGQGQPAFNSLHFYAV